MDAEKPYVLKQTRVFLNFLVETDCFFTNAKVHFFGTVHLWIICDKMRHLGVACFRLFIARDVNARPLKRAGNANNLT